MIPSSLPMDSEDLSLQIDRLAKNFEKDGFGVVHNFLTDEEIESLRKESARLVSEESRKGGKRQIFGNEFNAKNKFFLDSGERICYFFEKKAIDHETHELLVPEEQSVAKIGHALHCLNPEFKRVTTSQKVKDVFKAIGFTEPTVVQSMVIFKNPQVGGAYTPHQDASFLYADPLHLAGIWIALDDATPANGCLEFIPESHKWPLFRRFVRTGKLEDGEDLLEWTAEPRDYDDNQFVKVPVKRGDMVLIHGLVLHRSASNNSDKPRWIYTFHAYDRGRSVYSKDNWLQTNEHDTFMPIYKREPAEA